MDTLRAALAMDREAVNTAAMAALLRPGAKGKVKESGTLLREDAPSGPPAAGTPPEAGVFQVVLISEGLGNRRQKNYYGPEAIESAPAIFEGRPCFIDHPSASQERDLPERSVWHKAGYFKNCRVEQLEDGRKACCGELHLDASESGRFATDKARAALHYRVEFPASADEYVGLSVNADGETERRTLEVDGETLDVNYVLRFTAAMSCDIVTTPARGGRFLALVESAAGAIEPKTKEDARMIIESLKAALAALKESENAKDTAAAKVKLAEGKKAVEQLLVEAEKAVKRATEAAGKPEDGEAEGEGAESEAEAKGKQAASMYEKGAAMMAQAVAMGHVPPTGKPAEPAPEKPADKPADAPADKPAEEQKPEGQPAAEKCQAEGQLIHLPDKAAGAQAEADDKDDDDAMESKRLAVMSLLKEAGLEQDHVDFAALLKGTLKEARATVERTSKLKEAVASAILKSLTVPAGHPAKVAAAGDGAATNQALFSDLKK